MQLQANSKYLNNLLNPLRRVVIGSSIIATDYILISGDEDKVEFVGTDLETTITCHSTSDNVKFKGAGVFTIEGSQFLSLLKNLSKRDNDVVLEASKGVVLVTCGKSKYELPSIDADQFPNTVEADENVEGLAFVDANVLADMVEKVKVCVSTDDLKPQMMGVNFNRQDGNLFLVATDAHRMRFARIPSEGDDFSEIVPIKACDVIGKMGDVVNVDISAQGNSIVFNYPEHTIQARLVDQKYPAWRSVIPNGYTDEAVVSSAEMQAKLSSIGSFASVVTRGVVIDVSDGKVVIRANDIDTNRSGQEEVSAKTNHEGSYGFNVTMMMSLLKTFESDDIRFMFGGNDKAILVYGLDESGEMGLIMPMMIEG